MPTYCASYISFQDGKLQVERRRLDVDYPIDSVENFEAAERQINEFRGIHRVHLVAVTLIRPE